MPFNVVFDPDTGIETADRTRTGPPVVPSIGTTESSDGIIVGSSEAVNIAPATPIPVTMPAPRTRVMNADGSMSNDWWRFLSELYRRTGAIEDNINWATSKDVGSGTSGAIVLSGAAPSAEITHSRSVPVGSATLLGAAPEAT